MRFCGCAAGLSTRQTSNCSVNDRNLMQPVEDCHIEVEEDGLPIPVWPLAAFFEVKATLSHSFQAFLEVQAKYNASEIRLGS